MNAPAEQVPQPKPVAYCDLIMKGGITSGVVYPRLAARLAEHYRFKNIGGASAGAIAAAGAAAAEYGRTHGNAAAFKTLDKLPCTLGKLVGDTRHSMLFYLFQAPATLRAHFNVLTGALNATSKVGGGAAFLFGLLRQFKFAALLAAIPGLLVLVTLVNAGAVASVGEVVMRGLALAITVAIIAIAMVAGAAFWFVITFGRRLPKNNFGICTGMPGGQTSLPTAPAALTPWLYGYFNELAGLAKDGPPLTFGHLWGCRERTAPVDAQQAHANPELRNINLEMMTTAVSLGLPFRLPFKDNHQDKFLFDPDEWKALFPAAVCAWVEAHSTASTALHPEKNTPLFMLPAPADFPVIIAVRMSLSFPVLLCAIPLYSVDYTLEKNQAAADPTAAPTAAPTATRVWFSDGGITSNLPLHFFDSKLPAHPTFAVNLKSFHPEHTWKAGEPAGRETGRVYLPVKNAAGLGATWSAQGKDSGIAGVVSFLVAIVETMHNWRDNIQLPYPGYRDRIAQISQKDDEGGLNLDMRRENIEALSQAGLFAAEQILDRFAVQPGSSGGAAGWRNHRAIRIRTFLGLLEELVIETSDADRAGNWRQLLANLPSYKWQSAPQLPLAIGLLDKIEEARQTIDTGQAIDPGISLQNGAPKPRPIMRISPDF